MTAPERQERVSRANPTDGEEAECIAVAVACDASGRSVYGSLDAIWFRLIDHLPDTQAELATLYSASLAPKLHLDELQVRFGNQLVVLGRRLELVERSNEPR